MSTGGSWQGETKRRLEENGINKHDLRWDRKELQTGLEIQIWNYLYTGRKGHCVWTDELPHWDKYLLERAENLGFTLRKYGNLGVLKQLRYSKEREKAVQEMEAREGQKTKPLFSGSADAFPSSFSLNLVLGSYSSSSTLFSWLNWSHCTAWVIISMVRLLNLYYQVSKISLKFQIWISKSFV